MSRWHKHDCVGPDLPPRAFRPVAGKMTLEGGDGGGGSAPANTTQSTTSIPEYARPYVEEMLGKTQALTGQAYQPYTGQRTADFGSLQNQAMTSAGGMSVSPQFAEASGLAGAAASKGLGTNYTAYQPGQFTGSTAASYMSPYMQNVVDAQQREAQRAADVATTQRNASAVSAGAFGGSRQAITDAEAARNLALQKGDIQAKGLQSSYDQAQNMYNAEQQRAEQSRQYGAGLGLQGLSTALQGAQTMGQLGATQGQQGIDIANLQNTVGAQQQKQQQDILSQQYQDFLNQQNYPYKQIGFMSDILRGTAGMTQQSQSVYQSPPTAASQLMGLGTAAYGLSKLAAGGEVHGAGLADLAVHRMH